MSLSRVVVKGRHDCVATAGAQLSENRNSAPCYQRSSISLVFVRTTTNRRVTRLTRRLQNWRDISLRTIAASTTDHVSLAAAGCAFYATLSLFPAISMVLSVYGLLFDTGSVVPQLEVLRELLPRPAFMLIEDRVLQLVAQPQSHLTIGLGVAFLISFLSSASASKAMLSAMNVAYDATVRRPFLRFQLIGFAMTLGTVACAMLAIAGLLVLPRVIQFSGLSDFSAGLIQIASLGVVIAFFATGLGLLYARGPARPPPRNPRILPGTALATVMWLLSSYLLSLYVGKLANFDATYGSIAAVVGIMLWFYISAYAALLGAELNAQLEAAERENAAARDANLNDMQPRDA